MGLLRQNSKQDHGWTVVSAHKNLLLTLLQLLAHQERLSSKPAAELGAEKIESFTFF